MEEYIIDGETFSKDSLQRVADERGYTFDELLQKNPNIQVKESPTNQSAFVEPEKALDMDFKLGNTSSGTQEDPTWIERTLGKNVITDLFGDIWRAGEQGFATAEQVGESLKIYNRGVESTDTEIMDFVTETNKARGIKMSDEMIDFQRIYEEEGKGVWGFLKGVISNPTVIPQVFASSMATLAGSFMDAPEVAASGISAAGAGALMGSATGPGSIVTAPMGGIAGLFGGVAGAMETGLTFGELMREELSKEGKEFNKENVRDFLNDDEKFQKLKRRAVGRGISIGAIESFGGVVAGGVGAKLWTGSRRVGKGMASNVATRKPVASGTMVDGVATRRPVAGTLAAIGIESVAGGTGEIVGRKVAGQEMDVAEIGFEAIAGTATAPINLAAAMINRPSYYVKPIDGKKEPTTRAEIENILEGDDIDILNTDIEVKNDPVLNKRIHEKKQRALYEIQLNMLYGDGPSDVFVLTPEEQKRRAVGRGKLSPEERKKWVDLQMEILELKDLDTDVAKVELKKKQKEQNEIIEGALERDETFTDIEEKDQGWIADRIKNIETALEKNLKIFKEAQKIGVGVNTYVYENEDEMRTKLEEIWGKEAAEEIVTKSRGLGGFYYTTGNLTGQAKGVTFEGIFVNKDIATKTGNITVASHELLHPISKRYISGEVLEDFKNVIGAKHRAAVENFMRESGVEEVDFNKEFLEYYSDLLIREQLPYDETIFTKIGEFIVDKILKPLGFKTAGFASGNQVYQFMREYKKSVDQGAFTKRIDNALMKVKDKEIRDVFTKQESPSKALPKEQQQKLNDQVDKLVGPKNEDGNYTMTKAEWDNRGIEKAYNAIIQGNLLDGLIRIQFKDPETKTLLENVYGRTIKEATEAVKTGVPGKTSLTETLMKFNPEENNSLIGWINKQLGFRVGDVTNYFKDRPKATGQAQEAFEKTSRETPVETTDTNIAYTPEARTVVNEKDIEAIPILLDLITKTDNVIDYYANIKEKTIDLSDNELSEMNYANVKDMAPSITNKMFGELTEKERKAIKDKAKTEKAAEREIARVEREIRLKFIRDNAKMLHELLPNAAMTRAAGEKGLKSSTKIIGSVLQNFYTKEEATEETTGRGTTTAAGLPMQNKNKFNQKVYDDLFGPDPSIGPRNQKETLLPGFISEIGRAFTNSVLRTELTNRDIDPNVIHVLGDGKSEILASNAKGVNKKTGVETNWNEIMSNELPIMDIDANKHISAKKLFNHFSKEIPKIWAYMDTNNNIKEVDPKHFKPYIAEYIAIKTIKNESKNKNSIFYNWKLKSEKLKGPDNTGDGDITVIIPNWGEENIEAKWDLNDTLTFGGGTAHFYNNVFTDGSAKTKILDSIWDKAYKVLTDNQALINEYLKFTKQDKFPVRISRETQKKAKEYLKKKGKTQQLATLKLGDLRGVENHYKKVGFMMFAVQESIYSINKEKLGISRIKGEGTLDMRIGFGKFTGTDKMGTGQIRINNKVIPSSVKTNPSNKIFKSGEILASKAETINLNKKFNIILEETKGVARDKVVGDIDALLLGKKKDRPRFMVPYSAEDLEGLVRYFAGKGKKGNEHIQFFEDYLFKPLTEAQMIWDSNKLKADNQWKDIRKAIKKSGIDLGKPVKSQLEPNLEKYTNEQVIRAAMWIAKGAEVDGIDVKEAASIMRYVRTELEFTNFMEQMYNIFPDKMYPTPVKNEAKNWLAGTILTDILDSFNNKNTRAEYFKEFWENAEQIFGKLSKDKLTGPNINKIKSLYGENFVDSLGNILYRIKSGRNREYGTDRITNGFMNWTNDAVGTIMFFNTRSALLQMISFANFINWSDNNAMAATARFMDQKQYWNDFAMIFNSDFLKSRRRGLRTDVNADEIADAAAKAQNKIRAALSSILKLGFLPTQIADSVAISIGGASFYRNRVNSLMKNGVSKKDAEQQAFRDFQALATASQQSALPWRISKQQAGPLGRVILAFQNTPMQYVRLIKKAVMDLKNGRGDFKTNLSKITYYMAIQNIIFHSLQSAMFALMFTDEDEEERKKAYQNLGNRVADTLLVGTGVYGAIAATTKNVILEVIAQEKSGRRDFEKAAIKSTALSPPISSKLQKLLRASRRFQYKQEREKIREMGLTSQNPAVISAGEILSAVFNLPADRAIRKWNNLVKAADSETELWQSIALSLGYSEWDVKLMDNQKEPAVGLVRKRSKSKSSLVRKRKK